MQNLKYTIENNGSIEELIEKVKDIYSREKLFKKRIFWSCRILLGEDGYYYHVWRNWFLDITESVFAGYYRSVL